MVGQNFHRVPEANSKFHRVMINWGEFEPRPGELEFEIADYLAEVQASHGVEVVITLRCNAYDRLRTELEPGTRPNHYAGVPEDMDHWIRYVNAFVERYDGDGIDDMPGLTGPVKHWQVENEWLLSWIDSDEH